MFKIFLSVNLVLFTYVKTAAYSADPYNHGLTFESEYRTDKLNETENMTQYLRSKIEYKPDPNNSAHFGLIYKHKSQYSQYTWNVCLKNDQNTFECIIGNFFCNYGSGLLIGYTSMFTPVTNFAPRQIKPPARSYKPCNSGNNTYAFKGITTSYQYSEFARFSFYYSIRHRYTGLNENKNDTIDTTIISLQSKTEHNYNNHRQVSMHDSGLLCHIVLEPHFIFQIYGNILYVKDAQNQHSVSFNNPVGTEGNITTAYGPGCFLQYKDTNLLFYCDFIFPGYTEDNKQHHFAFGMLHGLTITTSYFSSNSVLRYTDGSYYAPYSTYNPYAHHYWHTTQSVELLNNFIVSFFLLSEYNKHVTSASLPNRCVQNGIEIQYNFTGKSYLTASASTQSTESNIESTSTTQFKIKGAISEEKKLSVLMTATVDYNNSISYYCGLSFLKNIYNRLNAKFDCTYFSIANNNIMYKSIFPNPKAYTPYSRIDKSSIVMTTRLTYYYSSLHFSIRHQVAFNMDRIFNNRVECYSRKNF